MYKIKNTELDFESRIFHLHKIFYSSIFFIIANPPYLICSNEILSFLLELSHISVENGSFISISVS